VAYVNVSLNVQSMPGAHMPNQNTFLQDKVMYLLFPVGLPLTPLSLHSLVAACGTNFPLKTAKLTTEIIMRGTRECCKYFVHGPTDIANDLLPTFTFRIYYFACRKKLINHFRLRNRQGRSEGDMTTESLGRQKSQQCLKYFI